MLLQEATLTRGSPRSNSRARAATVHRMRTRWALDGVTSGRCSPRRRRRPTRPCVQRVRGAADHPAEVRDRSRGTVSRGRADTLAVANVMRSTSRSSWASTSNQLDAVAAVLAATPGPGDLRRRLQYLEPDSREIARLKIASAHRLDRGAPPRGERSRFLGMPVDYLFVRGFEVERRLGRAVQSSDHAPIRADAPAAYRHETPPSHSPHLRLLAATRARSRRTPRCSRARRERVARDRLTCSPSSPSSACRFVRTDFLSSGPTRAAPGAQAR